MTTVLIRAWIRKVKSFYKATSSSTVKQSPAAKKRAIVAGKVINKAITKTIKGGTAYKPYTGKVKPIKEIHAKLTPAKAKENKKPKFDLKASLAKKPTWNVKTGTVKKFKDTTQIPNCVMESTVV